MTSEKLFQAMLLVFQGDHASGQTTVCQAVREPQVKEMTNDRHICHS